jgi:hypothetical protein
MQAFLRELITELAGEPVDTRDWEKAVLALLIAILTLGLLTIWQVSIFAPLFLFQGAIAVYILLLVLTVVTWTRIMWIYLIDGVLGLGLVAAALSPSEHFALAFSGAILPVFIMIVGDLLSLLLGVTSLYVFWKRYSPQLVGRLQEYRKVHEDCAPNAPCRTIPGYRV